MTTRDPAASTTADVAIVGGGVIGLAAAYALLRRGRRVTVLDRGDAGRATDVAAGMLAPVSEADFEEAPLVAFGLDSLARYPALVAALERETGGSCGYRDDGTIWVAINRDEDLELDRLEGLQRRKGVSAERLSGGEIRAREPAVTPRAVGGLWVPGDHAVDPRRLAARLREAITARGGELLDAADVGRMDRAAGGDAWRLRGRRGEAGLDLEASVVVVAAGAWATATLAWPGGAPPFEVRPVRGEVLRLDAGPIIRHSVRTPRLYLVPRAEGELVIGATMEEQGFDPRPTAGGTMDLLRHAWLAVPAIYDVPFTEVRAGFRPALPDHMPVIDEVEPGLFAAIGHHRNGILLAAATADHLAAWIVDGARPSALAPFAAARFTAEGAR